jgi:hypothetical protein
MVELRRHKPNTPQEQVFAASYAENETSNLRTGLRSQTEATWVRQMCLAIPYRWRTWAFM